MSFLNRRDKYLLHAGVGKEEKGATLPPVYQNSAFITRSIDANTRVSMKNLEMEYTTNGSVHQTKELNQSDEWYYII